VCGKLVGSMDVKVENEWTSLARSASERILLIPTKNYKKRKYHMVAGRSVAG
jgi:hypothetical protein